MLNSRYYVQQDMLLFFLPRLILPHEESGTDIFKRKKAGYLQLKTLNLTLTLYVLRPEARRSIAKMSIRPPLPHYSPTYKQNTHWSHFTRDRKIRSAPIPPTLRSPTP
jgi:hypothetical protein